MLIQRGQRRTDRGFTLVELLVVIAIIGILVALLLPAVQAAREAARRMNCQANMKNIALAMLNYESANNAYPPGATYGRTAVNHPGWHFTILPYLEDKSLFDTVNAAVEEFEANNPGSEIDFGSGSLGNPPLRDINISVYQCPSDPEPFADAAFGGSGGEPATNYAGVMGAAGAHGEYVQNNIGFGGVGACRNGTQNGLYDCYGSLGSLGSEHVNADGMLFPQSRVKVGQVTDGTSKTYLVGERWYIQRLWSQGARYTGVPAGQDIPDEPRICGSCFSYANKNITPRVPINADLNRVGFAVYHEPQDARPGPPTAAEILGHSNLPFGSFHPGGANFAYADGSVHFENDDIDDALYIARGSRNLDDTGQEQLQKQVTFLN